MGRVVLVIGGARSGKTAFALAKASEAPGTKVYVATAQPLDGEMVARIEAHKRQRGSLWETLEEPLDLGRAIEAACRTHPVAVIDCLTLWLSNLLCARADFVAAETAFIDALNALPAPSQVFVVSNEVGMGIVPENEMARQFRDMAGRLNQRVAEAADEVFLVAAGIPVKIK
jgi:adenosylcobinamide kinase/adenosylcobinamide-phosphate guanylyltransferase